MTRVEALRGALGAGRGLFLADQRREAVDLVVDERVDERGLGLRRPLAHQLHLRVAHQRRDVAGGDLHAPREQVLRQRVAEIGGVVVAVLGVPGQRLAHHALELGLDVGVERLQRRHPRLADLLDGGVVGVAVEQALAREQLPQDDAHREHVGASVDLEPARGLGGQVAELALHHAGIGRLDLAVGLGQAEVHELHLAVLRQQDVRRRDVAVDDAERLVGLGVLELVGVLQRLAALDHHVDDRGGVEALALAALALDQPLQVAPVHELHHEEVRVVGRLRDVEDLDDVGVLQEQRQPRLVEEHADELLVLRQVRQDAFDRNRLLEALHRLGDAAEDLRHAAVIEAFRDRISVAHPRAA